MEDILAAFPDRETFDRYWEENYVPVTYEDVKEAFEDFVTSAGGHIFLSDYEEGGCISKEDFKDNLSQEAQFAFQDGLTEVFYDKNPDLYETAFAIFEEAQMSGNQDVNVAVTFHETFNRLYAEFLDRLFEEKQFSENSFGFRPNRGAHDALKQCQTNVNDGYVYVVDMDLEKFFDTVCQSKLIEVLSRTIKDGRVISLIHKYLNAGVISRGMFEKTEIGMPQGGPLSPLLSNIMLNELDKELTRRGHRFVRYADDCMIFCKSRKSAERTLNNIVPYIEGKLFLKVNRTKTCVAHISKVKYLGYGFYRHKGTCRFRVHPKSIIKMKNRIRELTDRHNGWGNEYRALKLTQFIRGWVNYFGMADMKSLLQSNDKWLRHRIRAVYWKQWKKTKTKYRKLKELGMNEDFIQWHANMRQGIWNCSNNRLVQFALNNEKLREWGYPRFTEFYLKRCEN